MQATNARSVPFKSPDRWDQLPSRHKITILSSPEGRGNERGTNREGRELTALHAYNEGIYRTHPPCSRVLQTHMRAPEKRLTVPCPGNKVPVFVIILLGFAIVRATEIALVGHSYK